MDLLSHVFKPPLVVRVAHPGLSRTFDNLGVIQTIITYRLLGLSDAELKELILDLVGLAEDHVSHLSADQLNILC